MRYQNTHPWFAWLAIVGGALGIAFAIFLLAHVWEHRRQVFPQNLGNDRARALLAHNSADGDVVRFAVVGDINNGTETFEKVISRLREEKDVAFLILLGDCAADPNHNLHTYFIDEFTETGFSLPTFVVAGNHDVSSDKFGYREFEKLYGPANFDFMYRNNLFIGLGGIHDAGKLGETLSFLEYTLREKRSSAKNVFVFMHYPPVPSDYVIAGWQEQMNEFQSLFEQYKVTYVMSGHYHRLVRTQINGVVYLITGGGGARLRRDRFYDTGLFHHITIITMKDNAATEHIIPIEPVDGLSSLMERVEREGLTILIPWLRKHPAMGITVAVIIMGIFLWGAIDRLRHMALLRSYKNVNNFLKKKTRKTENTRYFFNLRK